MKIVKFIESLTFYLPVALLILSSQARSTEYPSHGLVIKLDSQTSNSLESPTSFRTSIDVKKPGNNLKSTEELVNQTAGIDVDDFGGLGRLSTISIRGSASNQSIILLDGIKLNTPSNQSVDLASLPLGMADHIEITRGSTSAEYGDGGIGGIINIVPSLHSQNHESAFSLKYGSFLTSGFNFYTIGRSNENSYLLSASLLQSEGAFKFTNPNNTPNNSSDDYTDYRGNNHFTSAGLFTKWDSTHSKMFRTVITDELYYSAKGIPGTLDFPSLNAHQEDLREVMNFDLFIKGLLKSDLKFTVSNIIDVLEFEDPKGELTGTYLKTHQIGYNPGLNLLVDTSLSRINLLTLNLGSKFHRLHQTTQDTGTQSPLRINSYFTVKDQINLLRSRVVISPVLRFDHIYDKNSNLSDNDFIFTPKMGFLVSPTQSLDFKTNFGTSFRYPNFDELYFSEGFIEGNPDLKPENAINFDIGFKLSSRIHYIEIAYFINRITDIIIYEQISNFRYKPINIDKAIIQGVEFSAGLKPCNFLKLTLNNTFTDPKNLSDDPNKHGKMVPGRPSHKTNLRITLFSPSHEIYSEFQFISSNFANEANTVKLDPRYLVNIGYSFNHLRIITFSIEIKNILNNQVEDIRGFPLPGTSLLAGLTFTIT